MVLPAPPDAPRPSGRRRLAGLTLDRIVAVSLDLLDRDGLEGFTMRAVAKALDVQVGALYVHVRDKEALLTRVAAVMVSEVELPDVDDWEPYLRRLARGYRRVLHRHVGAAQLVSGQLVSNSSHDFPLVEGVLGALARGGFEGQALVDAYDTYLGWLVGFVGLELAPAPAADSEWVLERRRELSAVDAERYPVIAANVHLLRDSFVLRWRSGAEAPMDRAFERALDVVLLGLQHAHRLPG